MTTLNRDHAETVFRKLEITPSFSTHFVSGLLRKDGMVVTVLHYSNGNADMSDQVFQRLRRALHLTTDEFFEFYSCYMSKQRYLELLQSRLDEPDA